MSQNRLKKDLAFLHHLSGLGRQIISSWRAKLFFQQEDSFISNDTVKKRLQNLAGHELICPIIKGRASIWQSHTPYLRQVNNIYELANEAYPIASLAYSTALEVLRLTDQRFNQVHLCEPRAPVGAIPGQLEAMITNIMPPDTQLNDWQINKPPPNAPLKKVWDSYNISAHQTKNEWIFGSQMTQVEGVNVRVTSLERTLIDGLKKPRYCGGLNEVFKAWVRSLNDISVDRIISYTETYDSPILYQRVGYVCQTLGLTHGAFAGWKRNNAPRGGSRLLNPHKEFSSTYDSGWNLSINHPVSILENKDADYS